AVRGVRQAVAELEQPVLLGGSEPPGREAGVVEQPPEVVPRVREVGARGRGHAARVDAAEDADEVRGEDVGDGRRRIRCGSAHAGDSVADATSTWPCTSTSSEAAARAGP